MTSLFSKFSFPSNSSFLSLDYTDTFTFVFSSQSYPETLLLLASLHSTTQRYSQDSLWADCIATLWGQDSYCPTLIWKESSGRQFGAVSCSFSACDFWQLFFLVLFPEALANENSPKWFHCSIASRGKELEYCFCLLFFSACFDSCFTCYISIYIDNHSQKINPVLLQVDVCCQIWKYFGHPDDVVCSTWSCDTWNNCFWFFSMKHLKIFKRTRHF